MIYNRGTVEPGDAAPVEGEPFVPEDNRDIDLGPGLRVLHRGDKNTLLSSQGPVYKEDLEELKERMTQVGEAMEAVQSDLPERPKPPEPEVEPEPTEPEVEDPAYARPA